MFTIKFTSADHVGFMIVEDVGIKVLSLMGKVDDNCLARGFVERLNLNCIFTSPFFFILYLACSRP